MTREARVSYEAYDACAECVKSLPLEIDAFCKLREDGRVIMRYVIFLLVLAAFSVGCNKNSQSGQAPSSPTSTPSTNGAAVTQAPASERPALGGDADLIRQAVEDHVRNDRGINMSVMDMSVDSVSVNGDQAQASATFRVKQGGASMAMVYSLQRHGNNWLVMSSQPSDGQFVHPPMDKTHSGMSPSQPAPGMPDVQDFLKNHPATSSN
ncbi:MAG TPA: hypothetical protein VEJ46_16550 [Candidatus Acidoferrum sp.]|nr:hypothetical protein [Candidatus Acidoferrum sp.]